MRHQNKGNKLSRHTAHRSSMMRNLVTSLFEHGRVETTHAKAKAARPVAEKLVTLAKRGDLHARRQAAAFVRSPGDGPAPVRLLGRALRRPERRLYADPAARRLPHGDGADLAPRADRSGRRHRRAAPAAVDLAGRIARRPIPSARGIALAALAALLAPASSPPRRRRRGPEDAVLEIVEFSDLECPFCAQAVPVLDAFLAAHPDDVRLVFRHFPPPSTSTPRAAQAAIEAQRQGAFWPYHDHVFRTRRDDRRRSRGLRGGAGARRGERSSARWRTEPTRRGCTRTWSWGCRWR